MNKKTTRGHRFDYGDELPEESEPITNYNAIECENSYYEGEGFWMSDLIR
jgi:hypothetical protein